MATLSILRDVAAHNFDLDSEKMTVRKVSIFKKKNLRQIPSYKVSKLSTHLSNTTKKVGLFSFLKY